MNSELELLRAEERSLSFQLSENRDKQKKIFTALFLEKLGIEFGDKISFMDGRKEIIGIFHKIEYTGIEPNYPVVLLFKKDGSIGNREKRCWWSAFFTIKVLEKHSIAEYITKINT